MDCPVCLEPWDLYQNRPKGLPCAHSVCAACVGCLQGLQCPICRKAFALPVTDNFSMVSMLESISEWQRPPVWWCSSCKRPSSSQCVVAEHDVKRPKAALRRGLAGLATRCSQQLEGVEADCFQDMQDSNALAALELLDAERAAFKLAMTLDDGKVVSCEWRDGDAGVSALAKMCLVAAAAKGRAQASGEAAAQQRAVERVPPAPSQPATKCDVGDRGPDFEKLSKEQPGSKEVEKNQALLYCRQRGVRRIPYLGCRGDSRWSLYVLQLAGPTLQELNLSMASEAHLAALRGMPRLQRLRLSWDRVFTGSVPAPLHAGSLKWLRLSRLAEAPTWSLLRGHAASLEAVFLSMGALPVQLWPLGCSPEDLEKQLRQCGLRRLQRLVLRRPTGCQGPLCRAQLEAARRALQGCTVQCNQCDAVPEEAF